MILIMTIKTIIYCNDASNYEYVYGETCFRAFNRVGV